MILFGYCVGSKYYLAMCRLNTNVLLCISSAPLSLVWSAFLPKFLYGWSSYVLCKMHEYLMHLQSAYEPRPQGNFGNAALQSGDVLKILDVSFYP